ncbi:MAG: electron transport complex subunit RsxC, partial [Candidatus Cloacimonetes bacterium]|nr:electron transport complex subunit RsxC [Candidatus Cloacimonadota bacterium]
GAPAKPIVKVGDEVLAGQKIAEAGGFVSIPMHSSISGKVTKLDKFRHPTGTLVQGIEITSDGEDKWIELIDDNNYMELTAKDMKDRIAAAATVANIIIVAPPRTDFGIC